MHDEILEALKNGDAQNAEKYLTENTEKAFQLYKAKVREIIDSERHD